MGVVRQFPEAFFHVFFLVGSDYKKSPAFRGNRTFVIQHLCGKKHPALEKKKNSESLAQLISGGTWE